MQFAKKKKVFDCQSEYFITTPRIRIQDMFYKVLDIPKRREQKS